MAQKIPEGYTHPNGYFVKVMASAIYSNDLPYGGEPRYILRSTLDKIPVENNLSDKKLCEFLMDIGIVKAKYVMII